MRPSAIVLPRPVSEVLRSARASAEARARADGREPKPWYRVAKADDSADVYIYDEITVWGITAADFIRELGALDVSNLTLHINSPGGWVDDGIAIYNAVRDHRANVKVLVDGMAASIASVIAMAGDSVVMNRHASMMIHDASGFLDIFGYYNPETLSRLESDVAHLRGVMEKTSDIIAGVYQARAGGTTERWRDLMRAETWFNAEEAVAGGLADTAVAAEAPAANSFDLSIFNNVPERLLRASASVGTVTKRTAERALRDAGLSVSAAKAVLAAGWGAARDDDARDERQLDGVAEFIRNLTTERSVA